MMRMSHRQSIRHEQRQELTQRQRILQEIHSMRTTPDGDCPACDKKMNEAEIKAGWNNDPTDYTTRCVRCGQRFIAVLKVTKEGVEIADYSYLCRVQLFARMQEMMAYRKVFGEVFLYQNHPEAFWSLIRHFGSYHKGLKAFKSA